MRNWHLTKGFSLVALVLFAVSAACANSKPAEVAGTPTASPEATQPPAATAPPATPATPVPPAATIPPPDPTPAPEAELEPYDGELVSMRLPSLGVEAPIELIGEIPGRNQLDVPEPENIGWYYIYEKPGFGMNSLFSAHKDYWPNIRGPFYDLTEMQDGDEVVVVMDDGREYVYEVFFQRRYTRDDMPMHDLIWPHKARIPELLRPEGEEWITLYTCGGDFVATTEGGAGYYIHRDVIIARYVKTIPPQSVQIVDEHQQ